MKRESHNANAIFEGVTSEIRCERLDDSAVDAAAERVWARLLNERASSEAGVAPVDRIRGCADFEKLIPAYLHGGLSDARALLLEDHTRECLACRKALKEARTGRTETAPVFTPQTPNLRYTVMKWGIAAVLVIGLGLTATWLIQRLRGQLQTLHAVVQAADGSVYRVADVSTRPVAAGEQLQRGERIRTSKEAGAVLRLSDGSLIEMSERSEFSISENPEGITVHLDRGSVIVQAAKQRSRRLYVATDDCLVSVKGTIFSVNSGTKGSRVSVIEGEVHVDFAGEKRILRPGQQVSTHPSLDRVPVQDEIAWSRDAARYRAMLVHLREELDRVPRPDLRYSSRLLPLAPEGTVLYAAIPNLSATLSESYRLIEERIQQNPALREWWGKDASSGNHELRQVVEYIREFGQYLGAEIIVGAEMDRSGEPDGPFVLAEVNDPTGLRSYIEAHLSGESKKDHSIRIVDDPFAAQPREDGQRGELFIWINHDLLVASPRLDFLQQAATGLKAPESNRFKASAFYARLADLYREGAGLIVAADLERILASGLSQSRNAKDAEAAKQLGLTGLKHFILELKESQGRPHNRAVLTFTPQEHGFTTWLAAPGPMGALEFISPDANVVAAFVVKNPVALVDDLLGAMKTVDPRLWEQFKSLEASHGLDVRRDLATPLGGEFAFALDGPVLPTPSWKLVFEVNDPAHLQQTLERVVEQLNQYARLAGKTGLKWEQTEASGRIFYTLRSADFGLEFNYAFVNGYLVAAPSRALVERAIRYRESGTTLLRAPRFVAALPEDGQANFSAVFYQNLEPVVGPLARQLGGAAGNLPKEGQEAVKSLSAMPATLAYVYAYGDRMIMSINSEHGPFGLTPGSLLDLPGSFGLPSIFKESKRK